MLAKQDSPGIEPNIIRTENGDYAILLWRRDPDNKLVDALQQGCVLGNYCVHGFTETPYGPLSWLLVALGTVEEFANPNADLLWFDLILKPDNKSDYINRWFKILRKQDTLSLGVPIDDKTVRLNNLLHNQQLTEFLNYAEKAVKGWKPQQHSYGLGIDWLWKNEIETVIAEGQEFIPQLYGQRSPENVLIDCFAQSVFSNLPPQHPLFGIATEDVSDPGHHLLKAHLHSWRQVTPKTVLAERSQDASENLQRNWLFAQLCLENSSREQLKIAIGASGSTWIWADMPYKNNRPEVLFLLSKTYRYLLKNNWKPLLRRNNVLLSSIDIPTVAALGKVPKRKIFDSVDKVLQGAVLERQFAILQPTAIVIGKVGLQEIEYYPLSAGGLKCLFKVKLFHDSTRNVDIVLVGKLNAPAGEIEGVGVADTPELKLILFLVAIAYRDILVAREASTQPTTHKKGFANPKSSKAKPQHQQLKLVARVKNSSTQIGKGFADPERVVNKFSSYLRSCHLRRLHEGWEASEKALSVAQQYEWIVPEGYTFVQPALVAGGDPLKLRDEFRSISLMNVLFEN